MQWHVYKGGMWFRLFREWWGFSIVDRSVVPALFSVRLGLVKEYRIGRYGVQVLHPVRS